MSGEQMLRVDQTCRTSTRMGNCSSSWENPDGFTLVELLVVISILVLLMALLLPTLGRVRKQARGIACQAKLRQWGLALSAYISENEGHNPLGDIFRTGNYHRLLRPYCSDSNELLLCPMAARYETNKNYPHWSLSESAGGGMGSKYTAWRQPFASVAGHPLGTSFDGSYGMNLWIVKLHARPLNNYVYPSGSRRQAPPETPVLLDCVSTGSQPRPDKDDPPVYDGQLGEAIDMRYHCIDRHQAAVNGLFWDTTVRNIGLKELWTLKWSPDCSTVGPWTRTGGVRPEDWPVWMRRFKDY